MYRRSGRVADAEHRLFSPAGGSDGASLADWQRVMDARSIGSRHGRHGRREILRQERKVVGVVVVVEAAAVK